MLGIEGDVAEELEGQGFEGRIVNFSCFFFIFMKKKQIIQRAETLIIRTDREFCMRNIFSFLAISECHIADIIQFQRNSNNFMHSGSKFNIITGEINTYLDTRRFHSLTQLPINQKISQNSTNKTLRLRLPSLGSPKDKKAFQYSYLEPQQSPQQNPRPPHLLTPTNKSTTQNYTYQPLDLITHREINPNFVHLKHRDFTNHLPLANVKGILTQHIDKARVYAPNFHDGFEERVNKHQFNRKLGVCGDTLRIEKSYGLNRYFRKYK